MDIFAPIPQHFILAFFLWYSLFFVFGILCILYSRFNIREKEFQLITSKISMTSFFIGFSGILFLIFRFSSVPILSSSVIHLPHIVFVIVYALRSRTKVQTTKKILERRQKNKEIKNSVLKNTDPYLSALRKKKKK